MNTTIASVKCARVLSVHLTFTPSGWATFYVDDAQGTLSIESDWGSYSYRWGRGEWLGVEPPDLSLALETRFGVDYVTHKLFGPTTWVIDEKATKAAWRKEVRRLRRARELDADEARAAWDAIDAVDYASEARAIDSAAHYGALDVLFDPSPDVVLTTHPRFLILRDQLLPPFLMALAAERTGRARDAEVSRA